MRVLDVLRRWSEPAIRRLVESRLIALTIWAPGTFGYPPDRYANLYRIILPIFDLSLIYVGAQAIQYGVPAFDVVTEGKSFGDIWGSIVLGAAIVCFVGIAVPRFLIAETVGKLIVWACLIVYIFTMLYLSGFGIDGGSRSVVSGIAVAGVLLSSWRLGDIKTERRLRHLKHLQQHPAAV